MAKECLNVWQEAGFARPACRTARCTARCITVSRRRGLRATSSGGSATHDGAPTRPLNQADSHAAVDIGRGSIGRVVHPKQEARGQEITHADELRSTPKRFSRSVA